MITKKEVQRLAEALQESRNGAPIPEEDYVRLIAWAQDAKMNYAILHNVLKGTVAVNVLDGEVVFRGDEIIRDVKKTGRKL